MTKPQQNELRRSGKGSTDQDSAKSKAENAPLGEVKNEGRKVPPGNQPGWVDRES